MERGPGQQETRSGDVGRAQISGGHRGKGVWNLSNSGGQPARDRRAESLFPHPGWGVCVCGRLKMVMSSSLLFSQVDGVYSLFPPPLALDLRRPIGSGRHDAVCDFHGWALQSMQPPFLPLGTLTRDTQPPLGEVGVLRLGLSADSRHQGDDSPAQNPPSGAQPTHRPWRDKWELLLEAAKA